MPTKTIAQAPADLLAEFKVAPARKVANVIAANARTAPVPQVGDGAIVARGTRSRDDAPVLILRHGAMDVALPLAAVGAAIAHGIITPAEIVALVGAEKLAGALPTA